MFLELDVPGKWAKSFTNTCKRVQFYKSWLSWLQKSSNFLQGCFLVCARSFCCKIWLCPASSPRFITTLLGIWIPSCKLISHFPSKLFQCVRFKFAIKSVINLSFRICYQAYCYVKNQFVLNGFMEKSYLDIPDFLQTVAVFVKLHEKLHQHRPLIYHLCCYISF